MEEEIDSGPIMYLPDEIICIIMQNIDFRDILNFGYTCKHFYGLINGSQYIYKKALNSILPAEIATAVKKYCNGNWLDEIKHFYDVRKQVYEQLAAMASVLYWRTSDVTLQDVHPFWLIVLNNNCNFHYVIHILRDVIVQGALCLEKNYAKRPFTMTDVFYAKLVVTYLTHTFLAMKWVHCQLRNELTPEIVINFFVQWTDPRTMHSDGAVTDIINDLVEGVEKRFSDEPGVEKKGCFSVADRVKNGYLDQKQVLETIIVVMFKDFGLTISVGANLDELDIVKAYEKKAGHIITMAVLYQAVALRCGVHCELISFPNHLFLEWRNPKKPSITYKIELQSGELYTQRHCPYAPNSFRKEYMYTPDGFIQYIASTFLMRMAAMKNWCKQNTVLLLDLFSNNLTNVNPYRDFLPSLYALVDFKYLPKLNIPLNVENIHKEHLNILDYLANMNRPPTHFTREVTVKHHDPRVKFAVGMLAYHKKHDYLCIIRGWDLTCMGDWRRRIETNLEFGLNQPFYTVVAVDQSERYVAQENLIVVDRPTRLLHIEDIIAREFSHFDGYCYVPNFEKLHEYPGDEVIRQAYRNIAEQREKHLRDAI